MADNTADCCSGTLHEGNPVGRVETLYGAQCYVSDPPSGSPSKGVIVIVPDAFGWELPNTRVLADAYAKRVGAQVLVPEFMDGCHLDWSVLDSLEAVTSKTASFTSKFVPGFKVLSTMPLFLYRCRFTVVNPRIVSFLTQLREAQPTTPVGCAGFCWGGKFVFTLCSGQEKTPSGTPLIDCGFTAHPSNLTLPADAEGVTRPLFVSAGSEDFVMKLEQAKGVGKTFEKKGGKEKGFEVTVVEGAKHGFAVRGNPKVPEEAKQCQLAEDQAVEWYSKWLVKGEAVA